MYRPFNIAIALLCVFFASCSSQPLHPTILVPEEFSLSKGQTMIVDVNSGLLNITQAADQYAGISGTISNSQVVDFKTTLEADGLHIVSKYTGNSFFQGTVPPIQINLYVPAGISIRVNTFDSNVDIHDYSGAANLTSVAGALTANHVGGRLALFSNRGNVTVENSNGELNLLGNYGLLSVLDSHGTVSASTIIGTIRFLGMVEAGDDVNLETDHASIEIQLGRDSDASVQVTSTSGVVDCTMVGILYEGEGCTGTLQGGQGKLHIRTVSGNITLQPLP
ncbi:MAG: hypothetical protein WCA79_07005 [Anaerolineales bacterium]